MGRHNKEATYRGVPCAAAAVTAETDGAEKGSDDQEMPEVPVVLGFIPADPDDARLTFAGAIYGQDGKLDLSAYQELTVHYRGEPPPQSHPCPDKPGVRRGETVPKGMRLWDDIRAGSKEGKTGAGWIAVFNSKRERKKERWFNIRSCGSWRFAFLLARLQLEVWERGAIRPSQGPIATPQRKRATEAGDDTTTAKTKRRRLSGELSSPGKIDQDAEEDAAPLTKKEMYVGQTVRCRDAGESSWQSGVVISLQPLKVKAAGCLRGREWAEICLEENTANTNKTASSTKEGKFIRFLPKQIRGAPVLIHEGGDMWRVDAGWLKRGAEALGYRYSKDLNDRVPGPGVLFGDTVQGLDDGDWVKVELQSGSVKFLPKRVNGALVLLNEGSNIWRVDDTALKIGIEALGYRYTKNLTDQVPGPGVEFGSILSGIDEGDWLKIEIEDGTYSGRDVEEQTAPKNTKAVARSTKTSSTSGTTKVATATTKEPAQPSAQATNAVMARIQARLAAKNSA